MRGIIWAYNLEYAKFKLEEIEQNYIKLGINPIERKKSPHSPYVVFANGDTWRVVSAHEGARGYRANISYVDARINPEIINTIIRPCTIALPYYAIQFYYPPWDENEWANMFKTES